jgi:molybdenum cofactor cytidylyltransferase
MGHSLAAGAAAANGWRYAFVALADMPWVLANTLAELRALMEKQLASRHGPVIVQPTFDGVPGHPVGFSADLFPALRALQGDEGARRVLRSHTGAVLHVEVDDPGVLKDLDTPNQIAAD